MIASIRDFARQSPAYVVWIAFLSVLVLIGMVSIAYVLIHGLGVTNLSDQLPWGLWITVDLSAIALGAGAFTLSAAVYVFGWKRYEAIARAAVVVGLLGYTSAMIALFVDIGRPDRFYHPLLYWNVHSVLWEVTMCVMLYSLVLVMEVSAIVIESTRLRQNRFLHLTARVLHRTMPLFALLGMGLSLLHQSSLGATYGVLMARPVWYSPSAPVLFILSAVASGLAATIALTAITGSFMNKFLLPSDVLRGLTRFAGIMALAYLYLKVWSWAATQYYSHSPAIARDIELLAENTPYGFTFWWFEILLGTLIPAIIFLWPRTRGNRLALITAGALSVLGLITYRWNTTLSGLVVPLDWSPGVMQVMPVVEYTPALVEWGVTVGIIGYWWLAWSLAARFLKLYPYARNPGEPEVELEHEPRRATVQRAPTPAAGD